MKAFTVIPSRRLLISAASGDAIRELRVVLQTIHEIRSSIDVTDQPGMVDMDRTAPQTTLSGKTLFDVPFPDQNSLRSGLRMIPGVVQDSAGSVHLFGGAESAAQYTFEGFEMNDPLTGRFDARLSLEAIQSVDVTPQSGADSGRGEAGTMTIHARTGGDEFKISATNVFPGVETGNGLHVGSWSPRGDFSGPWAKGRAWFFATTEVQYTDTLVPQLPSNQDQSTAWRVSSLIHNQVNLTPRNNLFVGLLFNYYFAPRNGLSYLDPLSTTVDRKSNQWFGYIKDQHSFSRSSLLEVGFASSRTFSRQAPQGELPSDLINSGRPPRRLLCQRAAGWRATAVIDQFLSAAVPFPRHSSVEGRRRCGSAGLRAKCPAWPDRLCGA